MATFSKFNSFVEALAEKVHNLQADAITVALTAAANPPLATNTVLANLTQIAYTNLSSRVCTVTSSAQTGGVYKLVLADLTLTASGLVSPFRYIILFNDTATNKELIGYFDYGSDLTLLTGEQLLIDYDGAQGVLQLS